MAAGKSQWLDAQPLLRRVCAGMAVGELLHGPSFSLFNSTTAIEIGDPKMDIGLLRAHETGSAEELVMGGRAPVALPPPLLLSTMDRLLCLEATWHMGSMLPQTVFTSLYMLHPERLAANAPLHAFCLALRSACSMLVDMAHAGSVTEDEDFFVHTFGIRMLDLPGPKPVVAALQALAIAEEQLEQRVAGGSSGSTAGSCSGSKGSRPRQEQQQALDKATAVVAAAKAPPTGGGGGAPQVAPSVEEAAALLARVRFRRLLLEALQSMALYSQAGVEAACRQCQLAEAQLELVAGSAGLAALPDAAPGFVPDVNRRHMGLVPPRAVVIVGLERAIEHWRGLLRGLADALHSLLFVRGSWPALKAALVDFAAKNQHAIVRSALHLQLIKPLPPQLPALQNGSGSGKADDGKAGSSVGDGKAGGGVGAGKAGSGSSGVGGQKKPAAELPPWSPSQQMVCREFGVTLASVPCPDAALFVEQAAIAVQGQVYALCLNRCRQRRRLRRQLEDWKNIFDHGFNADVTPEMQDWLGKAGWRLPLQQEGLLHGQGPATTWAEREAAGCALLHLQLGFPLDLYAPHEYLQLYWYCDFLLECQYRLGHLLHSTAPTAAMALPPRRGPGTASGGRGGKQRGGRDGAGGESSSSGGGQLSAAEQVVVAREVELVLLEVERLMSQGLFHAAIALQQLGLVFPPDTPFNSEEQQYEQRFGCLEMLFRPEPLPYHHFRASTDAGDLPPARILAVALSNFQRAAERAGGLLAAVPLRALLREEQVRHLEGVQRIANQNAVATKLLAATSARAAAGGPGAAGGGVAGGGGEASPQPKPIAFKAQFDLKTALASSIATFYPAVVLKH